MRRLVSIAAAVCSGSIRPRIEAPYATRVDEPFQVLSPRTGFVLLLEAALTRFPADGPAPEAELLQPPGLSQSPGIRKPESQTHGIELLDCSGHKDSPGLLSRASLALDEHLSGIQR